MKQKRHLRVFTIGITTVLVFSVISAFCNGNLQIAAQTESAQKEIVQNNDTERNRASPQEAFQRILAGMGVRYLVDERRLEVDGWVNMQKGLVEVFACVPEGKTHESVVVLDCVPSALHAGLLALGLKPGTPVEESTAAYYKPPTGDKVVIHVRWKGNDGTVHKNRAEDWVWNLREKRSMRRIVWIFTGSFMQSVSGNPEDATYAADYTKSIVTTYHDANTILENPLPQGRDDMIYYAYKKVVPPVNTPITAVFEPTDESINSHD